MKEVYDTIRKYKGIFITVIVVVWIICFLFAILKPPYGKVVWLGRFVSLSIDFGILYVLVTPSGEKRKIIEKIIIFLFAGIVLIYCVYQFSTQCAPIFGDIIVGVKSAKLQPGQYSTFLEEIDGPKINYHRHCIKCDIDGEEYVFYVDYADYLKLKKKDKIIKIEYYKYSEVINKIEIKKDNV